MQVRAVRSDEIQAPSFAGTVLEGNPPPVGGPGWALVLSGRTSQLAPIRSIRACDIELSDPDRVFRDKDDLCASRREVGEPILAAWMAARSITNRSNVLPRSESKTNIVWQLTELDGTGPLPVQPTVNGSRDKRRL